MHNHNTKANHRFIASVCRYGALAILALFAITAIPAIANNPNLIVLPLGIGLVLIKPDNLECKESLLPTEPHKKKEGIIQTTAFTYVQIKNFPSFTFLQWEMVMKAVQQERNEKRRDNLNALAEFLKKAVGDLASLSPHLLLLLNQFPAPDKIYLGAMAKYPNELPEHLLNMELEKVTWKDHPGNCPDRLYLVLNKDFSFLEHNGQKLTITTGYSKNGVCNITGYSERKGNEKGPKWREEPQACTEWKNTQDVPSSPTIALLSGVAGSKGLVGVRSKIEYDFITGVLFPMDFWVVQNPILFNVRTFPIYGLLMALSHVDKLITWINPFALSLKSPISYPTRCEMVHGITSPDKPKRGVSQSNANKATIFVCFGNPRILGANYRRMTKQDVAQMFSQMEGKVDYLKFESLQISSRYGEKHNKQAEEDEEKVYKFLQPWFKRARNQVIEFFGNRYQHA